MHPAQQRNKLAWTHTTHAHRYTHTLSLALAFALALALIHAALNERLGLAILSAQPTERRDDDEGDHSKASSEADVTRSSLSCPSPSLSLSLSPSLSLSLAVSRCLSLPVWHRSSALFQNVPLPFSFWTSTSRDEADLSLRNGPRALEKQGDK